MWAWGGSAQQPVAPYPLPEGKIQEKCHGSCGVKRKSVDFLTCKGLSTGPGLLYPEATGKPTPQIMFGWYTHNQNCWSKKHTCLLPPSPSSSFFPFHCFLKVEGWNHESGTNVPVWQCWMDTQACQSLRHLSPFSREEGDLPETSYLTMWCSSWFIYQTESLY